MFEVNGEQMQVGTPSLSPNRDPNGHSNSKRRIVTDIQSGNGQRNMIHVQSLDTLGEIPSEHNLHTYVSQAVLPVPQEDPTLANMSPSKRTAMALDGSPMFTPLEVKFKNMSKFKESAKKNMSGRKYPTIDIKNGGQRVQNIDLEEDNSALPQTLHRNGSYASMQ